MGNVMEIQNNVPCAQHGAVQHFTGAYKCLCCRCPYPEVDGKDVQSYHLYKEENGEIVAYLRILPPGLSYAELSIGRDGIKSSCGLVIVKI